LAAGCSIILKASEETPGTAVALIRALSDAGLPDGVVNLVFGVPSEVSEKLFASEIVRKISLQDLSLLANNSPTLHLQD
jgi:succinate-semialdehyde dehydrogenase/glutarate-semialdehyde dehydrogenase